MSTVFSKIIAGEIPCYKIHEDELTFCFLTNSPDSPGHVLVVPKTECDKFYELEEPYYTAVFQTTKKIAQALERAYNTRIIAKIIGTEVPHVHIHVMPLSDQFDHSDLPTTPQEFEDVATKIISNLL